MHVHASRDSRTKLKKTRYVKSGSTEVGAAKGAAAKTKKSSQKKDETAAERVSRLYSYPGGPLVGWLFDEARRRGQDYKDMAAELGVTYGYINQLRSGLRSPAHISQEMADGCARYLGVPTIVVKLVAGRIMLSDFLYPDESEADTLDRALRQVQDDPKVRQLVPYELALFPQDAKKVIALLYSEATGQDVLGVRELPEMLRTLQRAAAIHRESELAVTKTR